MRQLSITLGATLIAVVIACGQAFSQISETEILASEPNDDDQFGSDVGVDGDRVIVGATFNDERALDAGAAYIFEWNESTWVQSKLTASDAHEDQRFGRSVAISGSYAVVGAYRDDEKGEKAGAVYIFKSESGTWNQKAKLTALDDAEADRFGVSVDIDGGRRVIVGAYLGGDDSCAAEGFAYIFDRDYGAETWSQRAKLTSAAPACSSTFGYSVSVSGNRCVVGEPQGDFVQPPTLVGSAYIFATTDGISWIHEATLAPPAGDGENGDKFGKSVTMDGNNVVVGAQGEDDGPDQPQMIGSAYYWQRTTGKTWEYKQKIRPSLCETEDDFGRSVSVAGSHLIIGSTGRDKVSPSVTNAGGAFLFRLNTTTGLWEQQNEIFAGDAGQNDLFGIDVSIGSTYAVVGFNRHEHDGAGRNRGAASIYAGFDVLGKVENAGQLKDSVGFSMQNYPNPCNPTTIIKYQMPADLNVSVKIYDMLGREVLTLVDGFQEAGQHQIVLDASQLASGVYFYRLIAGSFSDVKKLLVAK